MPRRGRRIRRRIHREAAAPFALRMRRMTGGVVATVGGLAGGTPQYATTPPVIRFLGAERVRASWQAGCPTREPHPHIRTAAVGTAKAAARCGGGGEGGRKERRREEWRKKERRKEEERGRKRKRILNIWFGFEYISISK